MKDLFLTLVIVIATTFYVAAQIDEDRKMSAQQRTELHIKRLDEKLTLTDEQKEKIRELYSDFNKQKYPREDRKEAIEKLNAAISLQLTADQQAIYKKIVQAAADHRKLNGKSTE
jgi:Ser-tRNA(Ala) deacylase AlaX